MGSYRQENGFHSSTQLRQKLEIQSQSEVGGDADSRRGNLCPSTVLSASWSYPFPHSHIVRRLSTPTRCGPQRAPLPYTSETHGAFSLSPAHSAQLCAEICLLRPHTWIRGGRISSKCPLYNTVRSRSMPHFPAQSSLSHRSRLSSLLVTEAVPVRMFLTRVSASGRSLASSILCSVLSSML